MTPRKPSTSELFPLLKLAAPVSAAMLGSLSMQLVDMAFVGPLGPVAIAGVSVGNAVFATLMIMGIGLSLGLDYLVAHAFGAGRLEECHRYFVTALYLAVGVSVIFTGLMWLAAGQFAWFGISGEIAAEGRRYLHVMCFSLCPFLLFSACRQYLQALGVAAPAMVVLAVSNVVNALLNWIFIYGHLGSPALGVRGSGLATCLARVFMFGALLGYLIWRDRKKALGLAKVSLRFSRELAEKLVRLGLPSGLQMLFEVGVFALTTLLAGRLGAIPLSAHQIVLQLASATFMIPLGLSSATAVRVGQALGAGERARAIQTGWTALIFGASFAVLTAVTMYAAAGPLVRLFTNDVQVIQIARALLLVASLFQISDALQVIGSGVLRGIGNTKFSMYANLAGHWLVGLPIGYALCFGLGWGVRGLWLGLSVGLTVVAVTLTVGWARKTSEAT